MFIINLIIIICIITLFIHLIINGYSKKVNIDVEIEKIVKQIIEKKKLCVQLKMEDGLQAMYDHEKKEITVSKGSTLKHVAEVFHELGHAIVDKDSKVQKFSVWQNILYYLCKYSFPLAVVLYIMQIKLWMDYLMIPIFILLALSLFFFTYCVIDEIKASKIGYELIKQNIIKDPKILRKVRICLYNGFNSYLMLLIVSIILLVAEIIYVL